MGARGPLAKREGRQRRGAPVTGELQAAAPATPEPPADLHADVLLQWQDFWDSQAAQVLADIDLPALHRLFRYRSEWHSVADRLRVIGGGDVVEGSAGQLRMHPLSERLIKLETTITALEDKLGLTPMARARLGISLALNQLTWQQVAQSGRPSERKEIGSGPAQAAASIDDLL